MQTNITIDTSDLGILLSATLRYALPRKSYIVGTTADIVRDHMSMVKTGILESMCQDIGEYLEATSYSYTHDIWENLLDDLEDEIDRQENRNESIY